MIRLQDTRFHLRKFLSLSTKYNLTNKVYYVLIVIVSLAIVPGTAKIALVWSRINTARGIRVNHRIVEDHFKAVRSV